ncbi:aminoglycoside adenylyltransferase domain-containing protein [Saccharothrix obliqua]|uniref:aminoglycoside adenylyltransferase domain-containing protein n=1 Tax=Saccharothrix obliqua TaxID=2861747 RepID=UPI001C5F3035|nr:aminoglycoside adenylyltransferase domain-containing protein [Saccharothrix obliqua]MBW4720530.1 DUF4111 domain-containing protein [Saccharothrix obliqua]
MDNWSPAVRALLRDLVDEVSGALGPSLSGLYAYGSLATPLFDERISDVDLFGVTDPEPTGAAFHHLEAAHRRLDERHPAWAGRVEFAFVGRSALDAIRGPGARIAAKRTGEPFELLHVGPDWLVNLHLVRTRSVALVGPPATEFIAEVPVALLRDGATARAAELRDRLRTADDPAFQSYAVLSACRSLYTFDRGDFAPKPVAADWAATRFPEHAPVIARALEIRDLGPAAADADPLDGTGFVHAVAELLLAGQRGERRLHSDA